MANQMNEIDPNPLPLSFSLSSSSSSTSLCDFLPLLYSCYREFQGKIRELWAPPSFYQWYQSRSIQPLVVHPKESWLSMNSTAAEEAMKAFRDEPSQCLQQ